MDERYMLVLIIDNDLMLETPFVAEYYVQYFCKVKDGTGCLGPESLTM